MESIKAVVALCDSADEELRHVAIETLLTFGEQPAVSKAIFALFEMSVSHQDIGQNPQAHYSGTCDLKMLFFLSMQA